MTDPNDEPGFDFASPRWREGEDTQRAVERDRRFWDRRPPGQHGAIDAGGSVPGQPDDEPNGPGDELAGQVPPAGAEVESDDSPGGHRHRRSGQANRHVGDA